MKTSRKGSYFLTLQFSIFLSFWLIWFISQRAFFHALTIMCHHHWLCTPPPGTGLDIETSYLVYICTCVPHICPLNIKWFWLTVLKWQQFWYFSLISYPANIGSDGGIWHIFMYLFFTYIIYTKEIMPL